MNRNEILKEVLEWDGTKWQHQQAKKQVACDCAGFVRGVYANLGGPQIELMDYPATWHLFKHEERMYEVCKQYLKEIPVAEAKVGDILLFAYRERFVAHHIGILLNNGKFMHADQDAGVVHQTKLDSVWKGRIRAAFRFRELVD